MTDEEYVRANWERVLVCDGSYRFYPRGTILLNWTNHQFYKFLSWAAAAEFTRERMEQIRQLEEEISLVFMETLLPVMRPQNKYWVRDVCRWSRILARLESALADLKRGLR